MYASKRKQSYRDKMGYGSYKMKSNSKPLENKYDSQIFIFLYSNQKPYAKTKTDPRGRANKSSINSSNLSNANNYINTNNLKNK